MSKVKIYCPSCGWDGLSSLSGKGVFGGECPQCGEEIKMVVRDGSRQPEPPEPPKWAGWCAACGGVIWAGQSFCSDCGWGESGWED